jgi:hypothetical protein
MAEYEAQACATFAKTPNILAKKDQAIELSSELAPQAQNYSRHNDKYDCYKCGVDYRGHDGVSGNELDAKHRNQKRAANG